jgi:hypothetical protein
VSGLFNVIRDISRACYRESNHEDMATYAARTIILTGSSALVYAMGMAMAGERNQSESNAVCPHMLSTVQR